MKANQVASALAFPVFFGMSCTAPDIVYLLLGDKWEPAILPISILALAMPFRAAGNILPPLLWGIGQPKTSAINLLIAATIMPFAFFVGVQWGPYGLSLGWLLGYPVVYFISLKRTCPCVGVRMIDSLKTMLGPMLSSIVMYAAVITANDFAFGASGEIVHLAQLVAVGVVTYGVVMFLFFRESISTTLDLVKG